MVFCGCVALSKPSNYCFALAKQDGRFRLFASLFSCFLKTDSVASFLREAVEMFSQFRFRRKDGLATFLYSNFCGLGSNLHCSSWPFIKVM